MDEVRSVERERAEEVIMVFKLQSHCISTIDRLYKVKDISYNNLVRHFFTIYW